MFLSIWIKPKLKWILVLQLFNMFLGTGLIKSFTQFLVIFATSVIFAFLCKTLKQVPDSKEYVLLPCR